MRRAKTPGAGRRRGHAQNGAALLLALLGALLLGLTLFLAAANARLSTYGREQATAEVLALAKTALIGYAATYRDDSGHVDKVLGYLPCPDTDNDGVADSPCGTAGYTMIGRLPYKTLGLSEARAADGECLWYVVSGSHKNNPKGALNWDTRGKIRVEDGNGTALIDPGGDSGGAVAAIIAPGPPLAGQNRPSGKLRCSGDASNGIAQYLDGNYGASTSGTLTLVAGQPGSASNNDRVAWISASELYAPIAKRSDLLVTASAKTLLAEIKTCVDGLTGLPLPLSPTPRANGQSQAVFLGKLDKAADLASPCATVNDDAWTNWKNQIGYVVCNDQTTGCLTVNGTTCRGALVFSGRQTGGKPRAANADFETLDGNTFLDATNLASYLSAGTTYAGASAYSGTAPDQDIVVCLKP